jgi:NSS family neurotransmitter:Na+ symporter
MGWTADTLFHSLFFGLPKNLGEAENFFGSISSGSSVLLGHLLSLVLTAFIVSSGIKKGIEKVTRYFMPILFIILLGLVIWATTLSGAWEGYKTFLFKFDFAELRNPQTIRNAFTQAFFSLSLGIGIMVTYASYLNKKSNLPKLSISVASLDTLVGLMAGLITFPIVLTFGLSEAISESTVGALFISIPTGLGSYGAAGRVVAVAFFALAYIAAITSSVSLLEVPVSSLMDKFGFQRGKSVWIINVFLFLAGIPSALNLNILGTVDSIFGGVLLIFGGFLVSFFMGWVVPAKFNEELNTSKVGIKTTRYLKFMMRWVSPPIIAFGLVISVFDLLKGWVS